MKELILKLSNSLGENLFELCLSGTECALRTHIHFKEKWAVGLNDPLYMDLYELAWLSKYFMKSNPSKQFSIIKVKQWRIDRYEFKALRKLEGVKTLDLSVDGLNECITDCAIDLACNSTGIENVILSYISEESARALSRSSTLKSLTLLKHNKWSNEEIDQLSSLIDIVCTNRNEHNEKLELAKEVCSEYNFPRPLITIVMQYIGEIDIVYETYEEHLFVENDDITIMG